MFNLPIDFIPQTWALVSAMLGSFMPLIALVLGIQLFFALIDWLFFFLQRAIIKKRGVVVLAKKNKKEN